MTHQNQAAKILKRQNMVIAFAFAATLDRQLGVKGSVFRSAHFFVQRSLCDLERLIVAQTTRYGIDKFGRSAIAGAQVDAT